MINRVYAGLDVTGLSIHEVETLIEDEGIEYSADYGFEVKDKTSLKFSMN